MLEVSGESLYDWADLPADEEMPRMGVINGITGVILPTNIPAGAIVHAAEARKLGARLLLAADDHDAFVDAITKERARG